jgi:hypothetical protein
MHVKLVQREHHRGWINLDYIRWYQLDGDSLQKPQQEGNVKKKATLGCSKFNVRRSTLSDQPDK